MKAAIVRSECPNHSPHLRSSHRSDDSTIGWSCHLGCELGDGLEVARRELPLQPTVPLPTVVLQHALASSVAILAHPVVVRVEGVTTQFKVDGKTQEPQRVLGRA
jgi:hypothetical protein